MDSVSRWARWRFDFTKQLIDGAAWDGLRELAEAANWKGARDTQFAGHPINETEGRAVLHMALRGQAEDAFAVDGEPVMKDVLSTREAVLDFADAVREGRYATVSGGRFTHVINIGIGGSDLGPVMVHEALAPLRAKEGAPLDVRFVSNVDPFHLDQALQGCEAGSTLIVIVSKTFTTQETMANAERALSWLQKELGDRAGSPPRGRHLQRGGGGPHGHRGRPGLRVRKLGRGTLLSLGSGWTRHCPGVGRHGFPRFA